MPSHTEAERRRKANFAFDPTKFTQEEVKRLSAGDRAPLDAFLARGKTSSNAPGTTGIQRPTLRNGASDGAGNPDPVTVDPIGQVTSPPALLDDPIDGDKGGFIAGGGVRDPRTPTGGGESVDPNDQPSGVFGLTLGEYREQIAEQLRQSGAPQFEIDRALRSATPPQALGGAEGDADDQTPEDRTPSLSTSGKLQSADGVTLFDYEKTRKLLTDSDIEGLIEEYQKDLVELDAEIGDGPTASINGVERVLTRGRDFLGNTGYGYYEDTVDENGLTQTTFILNDLTAIEGEAWLRLVDQREQIERFRENLTAAASDDARRLIIDTELARVNNEFQVARQEQAQKNALAAIEKQGEVSGELQTSGQIFANAQRQLANFEAKRVAARGREFSTEEREAGQEFIKNVIQAFNKGEREAAQDFITDYVQTFQTDEREAAQDFITEIVQGFQTSEREAAENFARDLIQGPGGSQEFTTEENRLSREATADQSQFNRQLTREQGALGRQAAETSREDTQQHEREQARLSEQFTLKRDQLNFDRESRLESARLGIADATSEEGIARAVEIANEARDLDRALAMVDVIESLAKSGLGRQLAESGILEQLSSQFGVDLSFLLQGGLGTGIGGGSPIRITA